MATASTRNSQVVSMQRRSLKLLLMMIFFTRIGATNSGNCASSRCNIWPLTAFCTTTIYCQPQAPGDGFYDSTQQPPTSCCIRKEIQIIPWTALSAFSIRATDHRITVILYCTVLEWHERRRYELYCCEEGSTY